MVWKQVRIYGIVQGVGFRPFVSRLARSAQLKGTVANKGSYVEIHFCGEEKSAENFLRDLREKAPERSSILSVNVADDKKVSYDDFEIIDSEKEKGDIFVSPDIAICPECKKELFDVDNRRYLHPFINCTACGPRLTILRSMPYDRERTSMRDLPMCSDCADEYRSPSSRRYDAQPVCCNKCGPEVYVVGKNIKGAEAITLTRKYIMAGKIVAIKGIGGFHLCCDGTDTEAVRRLRKLKDRPTKPFAVMMKDISTAERECFVSDAQKAYLDGCQKPILLLEKKQGKLCDEIAPDNPCVGVMLPYAPVQMLIFDYPDDVKMTDCLVMTSGNVRGAPICKDDESAEKEIGKFCDLILSNNREILVRADDSVMDWFEGKPYMIRRSRGYAPLPVMLSKNYSGEVLALGGELKNTFCIGKNDLMYPSAYVGDMSDVRTVNALKRTVERMEELLETSPSVVCCDMHPKYNTTVLAEEYGLPVIKLQHHYAHILSCMAENDYYENVIGIAFDGTGYGDDGTVWGGEILLCNLEEHQRKAYIRPFKQVGGDVSSREGWRISASMIGSLFGDDGGSYVEKLGICDSKMLGLFMTMAEKNINSVSSTSVGRLFDAVSAILGIKKVSTFEGEASMALEFQAEKFVRENGIRQADFGFSLTEKTDSIIMNTDSLVRYICTEKINGKSACELAYQFHYGLALMICESSKKIRETENVNVCALSGGVFQNKLLLKLSKDMLEKSGFKVLCHKLVPANDGGISLGQAVYAMNKINSEL